MLKNLEKLLESEKSNKNIFDIIVYGSSLKGKTNPEDIDIVVIFLEGSLSDRLNRLQKIKPKIKKDYKKVDIKQMLLKDLFSTSFLARTGILLEGYSLFKKTKFSETLGFKAFTLFWYDLKGLTHTEKVKFNYILAGRNKEGIIKELKVIRLTNGTIKIPIESSQIFESVLRSNNINFNKKNILEEV